MQVHNEILRNIARSCADFGIQEEAVYQLAGINAESIAVTDGMQDWKTGINLWESALKLTNYRLISLSFGKKITFSALGWIAPLTLSSPTLLHAWKSFVEFFPLMGNMFEYHFYERNNLSTIRYIPAPTWVEASPLTAALAAEHAMTLTLSISGYLSGKAIKPVSVSFCHQVENKYKPQFEDIFGNVLFGQAENMLTFDVATARLPVVSVNHLMYGNMLKLCSEKLQALESNRTYAGKVLRIFNSKQAYYTPKIEEVAAMLNMSVRTLQRKLKEENHTYHNLLEQYKIDTALQLLSRPHTQIQEVAFLLGFPTLQSFSRAFKRKTGLSPSKAKEKKEVSL